MEVSKVRLLKIVHETVLQDEDFNGALEIVKRNSSGKIWLIGGFLYKNIAHVLYGSKKSTKDFDLIVEYEKDCIVLPEEWLLEKNRFGNPKFVKSGKERVEIDFVPLDRVYSIMKRGKRPSIENYLQDTPLNMHSIAYDIQGEVIGDTGIAALERRVVSVNDLEMARNVVKRFYSDEFKDVNEMIQKKADELGFKAELV